ncbi:outer membrane biogenesis protein BamB [Rubripirellula obstinata]|uniref:Outer membrane biogenesis protein BamB n=1 Tax=Rubripirellula obstinata TaxID=406547 RepID=A0A5B1CN60_9BACT|nr:PQQ-binding-like beta-propeller repeat protein [Rubripirellula obstinata]KAA1261731.1 outer membrane biogenesis protein BamB [Rubripirellula obstinata]
MQKASTPRFPASIRLCVSLSIACCFFVTSTHAEDWPQWRGVNRDATIDDSGIVDSFDQRIVPRKWSVELGGGYSGPTVADGRVYVTDRGPTPAPDELTPPEIERVLCFDASDGSLIWSHQYDSVYQIDYRAGPRASVTVHAGKAIAVGAMGHLHCFDAKTGDILWKHDLADQYDIRMPFWGIAAAPLVVDGLVIQIAGGKKDDCVMAFDLETGVRKWNAIDERAGYSSPILIEQAGQQVVVCWTGESVSALDPKTGNVHWRIEMLPRNMPIGVPTPVFDGQHLLVSSFYDGTMLIRVHPDQLSAEKMWHRIGVDEKNTDALHCMISGPIIKGDHVYGVDSYGELRCLELKTGDRVWESDKAVPRARWATVHIIQLKGESENREIMMNDRGHLILATLSPDGYQEHSRAALIKPTRQQLRRRGGVAWAHPAIADGMIYIRSDTELVCASITDPE